MSSPEQPSAIILSPRARQDFIDILRFTGESWGPAQLYLYRDKVDDALQRIGRNPAIGRQVPELPETHRIYFVGSHVIVYRAQHDGIGIVRILHQRMSLSRRI